MKKHLNSSYSLILQIILSFILITTLVPKMLTTPSDVYFWGGWILGAALVVLCVRAIVVLITSIIKVLT